jgi:hypothetical protein
MARKKTSIDAFAQPAQKYVGKVETLGGPVPLGQWHRPYVRKERDRPYGAEGKDLRPEREEIQSSPPASLSRTRTSKGRGNQ